MGLIQYKIDDHHVALIRKAWHHTCNKNITGTADGLQYLTLVILQNNAALATCGYALLLQKLLFWHGLY